MKTRRSLACLLLIVTLLTLLAACAGEDKTSSGGGESAGGSLPEESSEDTISYTYPADAYYNGYVMRVMNVTPNYWGTYSIFDPEDSGEGLDTAVYNRNRKVEEKLGVVFQEIPFEDIWGYYAELSKSVSADSDDYDIAFCASDTLPYLMNAGCLINLADYPELQFDMPWWDQDVVAGMTVNDKIFSATGALHLMAADLTACIWFNRSVCEELNLDLPYDAVRDGKWTFDMEKSYAKAIANLNGQDTFAYQPEGSARYAFYTSWVVVSKYIHAFDMHYFEPDGYGDYNFTGDSETFITRLQALSDFVSMPGNLYGNDGSWDDFCAGRLFAIPNEVKVGIQLRDKDVLFGALPYPKWDENQESYRHTLGVCTPEFTIPTTNRDPERTAVVADMLAYYGYTDVLPVYYENYLFIKGLRDNSDDIEMIKLVHATRSVDTAVALQWIGQLHAWDALPAKVAAGGQDFASMMAGYRQQFINLKDDMLIELFGK